MKKILFLLSFFFVLFSFYPSLYEIYNSKNLPKERVFVLEHNYMFDYNFYLSRIREGMEGKWLVTEKYYNLPHKGSFFQIFYLLSGKVGGAVGLEPPAVYHMLRLLMGLMLLILLGNYIGELFRGWWQIAAYLLVVTSGSWPILVSAGGFPRFATYMGWWSAIDSLQRITFLPHVVLGQIFILLFIWRFGGGGGDGSWLSKLPKSLRSLKWKTVEVTTWGAAGFISGIIFPPALVVVYTYFSVLSVLELLTKLPKSLRSLKEWIQERGLSRGFFILISLPSLLYLQMMFKVMPWSALALFDIQHRMPLPYKEYFLALGPILPLGLLGLSVALVKREKKLFPVVSWVLGIFFLFAIFEKVPSQSPLRFTEALIHVPLGILAVYFLCHLSSSSYLKKAVWGLVFVIILMGFGVMVSMVGWLTDLSRAKGQGTWLVPIGAQLVYPLKDFMDGIYFIRDNTKRESVVLTYVTAGNYIPAYAGNYVYIGHANTPDEDGKEKIAAGFFKGEMSVEEAKEFLQKERISYIFFGPQEREVGGIKDLALNYKFLTPIFNNRNVIIFRVR